MCVCVCVCVCVCPSCVPVVSEYAEAREVGWAGCVHYSGVTSVCDL